MSWREPNRRGLDLEEPADGGPAAAQGPRQLGTGRKVLLGLILAALAIGLVAVFVARGEDSNSAAPTPLPTQVQTSTPPTASDPPPPLLNTGDDPDWDALVRSLFAFDEWLRTHPRPELVKEWIRPQSPGYAEAEATIRNLAEGTWRYDPPYQPVPIERVSLVSRHGPSAVVLIRFGPIPSLRGVDRNGNVVVERRAQPGNSATWTVIRDADGKWRFDKAETL